VDMCARSALTLKASDSAPDGCPDSERRSFVMASAASIVTLVSQPAHSAADFPMNLFMMGGDRHYCVLCACGASLCLCLCLAHPPMSALPLSSPYIWLWWLRYSNFLCLLLDYVCRVPPAKSRSSPW
jgi:hypothetical protein